MTPSWGFDSGNKKETVPNVDKVNYLHTVTMIIGLGCRHFLEAVHGARQLECVSLALVNGLETPPGRIGDGCLASVF